MKDNRFIELVNLYIDRQITGEEMDLLEAEMQSNPRRRAIYRQYCQMHRATTLVYESFRTEGAEQPADMLRTEAKIARFETNASRRRHWTYYATGLAAACVALALVRTTLNRTALNQETIAATQPVKPVVVAATQTPAPAPVVEQAKAVPAVRPANLVAEQDYGAMLAAMRKEDQRAFANGQIQAARTASLFEDGVFDPQNSDTRLFKAKQTKSSQQAEFAAFQFQR